MKDPRFLARYGVEVNVPLGPHTAIGTGVNADFFLAVSASNELKLAAKAAEDNGLKVCVIGKGTHIVYSSHGFRGLVIKNEIADFDLLNGSVTVGTGLGLTEVIHRLAEESCAGFEALAGTPRSVGGALRVNLRGGGTSISEHLDSATLYSVGKLRPVSAEDMLFVPDSSLLEHNPEYAVTATFRVRKQPRQQINQRILAGTQERLRSQPGAAKAIRVFKDPTPDSATDLAARAGMAGERVGGAVVSTKDPNYIINDKGATPEDVYELAQRIKHRVSLRLQKKLKEAVVWAGEW